MAELTYDDVRKILAILDASSLDEVHIEIGDFKLDVRRRGAHAAPIAPAPQRAPNPNPQPKAAPPAAPSQPGIELAAGQFTIDAPMLGTFYRAPAPDAPPFVDVGAQVVPGDTLCIIEVMKLMNTIKAERAGRVAAILVENATMVEFGEPLIVFDPS